MHRGSVYILISLVLSALILPLAIASFNPGLLIRVSSRALTVEGVAPDDYALVSYNMNAPPGCEGVGGTRVVPTFSTVDILITYSELNRLKECWRSFKPVLRGEMERRSIIEVPAIRIEVLIPTLKGKYYYASSQISLANFISAQIRSPEELVNNVEKFFDIQGTLTFERLNYIEIPIQEVYEEYVKIMNEYASQMGIRGLRIEGLTSERYLLAENIQYEPFNTLLWSLYDNPPDGWRQRVLVNGVPNESVAKETWNYFVRNFGSRLVFPKSNWDKYQVLTTLKTLFEANRLGDGVDNIYGYLSLSTLVKRLNSRGSWNNTFILGYQVTTGIPIGFQLVNSYNMQALVEVVFHISSLSYAEDSIAFAGMRIFGQPPGVTIQSALTRVMSRLNIPLQTGFIVIPYVLEYQGDAIAGVFYLSENSTAYVATPLVTVIPLYMAKDIKINEIYVYTHPVPNSQPFPPDYDKHNWYMNSDSKLIHLIVNQSIYNTPLDRNNYQIASSSNPGVVFNLMKDFVTATVASAVGGATGPIGAVLGFLISIAGSLMSFNMYHMNINAMDVLLYISVLDNSSFPVSIEKETMFSNIFQQYPPLKSTYHVVFSPTAPPGSPCPACSLPEAK